MVYESNTSCGETRQPQADPTGQTSLGGGERVGEESESLTMVKRGSLQGVMETVEMLRSHAKPSATILKNKMEDFEFQLNKTAQHLLSFFVEKADYIIPHAACY